MQISERHNEPPPPSTGLVAALATLVERLDDLRHVAEGALAVAEFAVIHLGADVSGLSQTDPNGRPQRLAPSGGLLTELDSVEAELGQGPGTAPPLGGDVLGIADTRADTLWPEWCSRAAARGVLSVCLIGMPPLRGRPHTLQLFSFRPGAFPPQDLTDVVAAAGLAGLGLRHLDRVESLERALETRDLIGQAQGIVMERYRLSSEQAMQFLRRSSQQSQEKIWLIAERLVNPSIDPGVHEPPPAAR